MESLERMFHPSLSFSSVRSLSCVQLFATPWTAAPQASLFITNSLGLLKLTSIKLMMPSNHLILCHPLCFCLQSFPVSRSFPMSQFFASDGQVLELHLQHQSFQGIFRTDLPEFIECIKEKVKRMGNLGEDALIDWPSFSWGGSKGWEAGRQGFGYNNGQNKMSQKRQ